MSQLLTILLIGFMPVIKDPPAKLLAFKQSISKAKPNAVEMTMEGDTKTKVSKHSANYLIWLVTADLSNTKIISVQLNDRKLLFDTAHVYGEIKLTDGIRSPMEKTTGRMVQDSTGASIRIYIKDSIDAAEMMQESIVVRYRKKGSCIKKIKKSIEVLPAMVTE